MPSQLQWGFTCAALYWYQATSLTKGNSTAGAKLLLPLASADKLPRRQGTCSFSYNWLMLLSHQPGMSESIKQLLITDQANTDLSAVHTKMLLKCIELIIFKNKQTKNQKQNTTLVGRKVTGWLHRVRPQV